MVFSRQDLQCNEQKVACRQIVFKRPKNTVIDLIKRAINVILVFLEVQEADKNKLRSVIILKLRIIVAVYFFLFDAYDTCEDSTGG
ncbi:MAG: hypothetical protein P6H82_02600 [Candidatus Arsenophonus melophagi]|nr:hypothetical protein [Candidatus Arsenophonus melophagi]